jgi:cysteine desulfurase
MMPFLTGEFGNPSSSLHQYGRRAKEAVEQSRKQVAALLGAKPTEIFFTSGATESNNLAILGLARSRSDRKRIVTTTIEHKAVLEVAGYLQTQGFKVIYLPLLPDGRVNLEAASNLIDDQTLLVSVQAASNEIGTLQPIAQLAELAREHNAFFHTDAAQAVGKIPLDVNELGIDLLSLSGHKLYGPKGVGALYVRGGLRQIPLQPLWYGGGQERGLRSGTYNVPGIVGLGKACELCTQEMYRDAARTAALRDQLEDSIRSFVADLQVNGCIPHRLPHNSSLTFPGIEGDALILNLPNLALSMGSACNSGALEPSYVLTAIGLSRQIADSTIRVGLGRFTTHDEIGQAVASIQKSYESLFKLLN